MTRRRLTTLILGVVFLGALSWWKIGAGSVAHPLREQSLPDALVRSGALAPSRGSLVQFAGKTMGTTYRIKYVSVPGAAQRSVQIGVKMALSSVNQAMSTYLATSEVSAFNRGKAGQIFSVSSDLMKVLQLSWRVHHQSQGAFDITVRPLVRAFGFGSDARASLPSEVELLKIRRRVGMKYLKIDPQTGTVQKLVHGVEMDLGAIAKGFGVDQAARVLEELGLLNYMVEVGGEIRVRGRKSTLSPWVLGIEEPSASGRSVHGELILSDSGGALATSGDYRNFHEAGGVLVSHTLDPRTGEPVPRRTASVSVIRESAAEADALATALGVLAPKEAIRLANRREWAVYLLVHDPAGGWFEFSSREFLKLSFKKTALH